MFKAVDLFAGCGGLSLGFKNAGFEVVGAFENWDKAATCYAANFGHPVFQDDLSDVNKAVKTIRALSPDIIIGGPPCQDFSQAGKRVEGARASLTVSFAEIVAAVHPKYFVMENVEYAQKSKSYKAAREIFKQAGYGLTTRVLDASYCGVPQARKRFFTVGCLGAEDDFIGNILDSTLSEKPTTVRDYLGDTLHTEYYFTRPVFYNRVGAVKRTAQRGVFSVDEPSVTLRGENSPVPASYVAHPDDKADAHSSLVRALTTKERSYLQTFPEDFTFIGSKTDVEKMIGNAVPVRLAEFVARALMHHIDTQKQAAPAMVSGTYNIILADPPWRYSFGKTNRGSIEKHYDTMSLDEIKSLQVPAASDSVLYLWATAPYLLAALDVMAAWGFTYKSQMVWDKSHMGIGYWARGQHELLLIGTKGKVSPPAPELRASSVYREKRTVHSRKPDYFNALLEKQHPGGRFLELFARRRYSEKWAVWGNEVECVDTENGGVL